MPPVRQDPVGHTRAEYRHRLRQQHSVPLLDAFKVRLDELLPQTLPKSLLGKATAYTHNQRQYLSRYISDGRAPVDNSVIERDIRPFCTGRKSLLFSDSVACAKASAMVYSLMLTCRACGVEPHAYLMHVLTGLPQRAPDADVTDLLPFHYAEQMTARTPTSCSDRAGHRPAFCLALPIMTSSIGNNRCGAMTHRLVPGNSRFGVEKLALTVNLFAKWWPDMLKDVLIM